MLKIKIYFSEIIELSGDVMSGISGKTKKELISIINYLETSNKLLFIDVC